jgi:sortase (surface protein transpeptidase)
VTAGASVRPWRRRGLLLAVILGAAAFTGAGAAGGRSPAAAQAVPVAVPPALPPAPSDATPATPRPDSPPEGPSVDLSGSPTGVPASAPVPAAIDIPSIGVRSDVVPLGRNPDGTLQVPDSFTVAGWYAGGPRPGDPGPALIVGHVDSYRGPAVFFRLKDLVPGDLIRVSAAGGSEQFRVDSLATFSKDQFPTALVYGPVPDRALRLVTCGGSFDDARHSYRADVVVFATEIPS